jgi:hypothetical protein
VSNKRILDGALWRSAKLRSLPGNFALHYANWIPLAAANGVFEADLALIQSTVYSYILPNISISDVGDILDAFEKAGLVQVYKANGKTWGYFTGIEKSGRLPELRYLSRYKYLPPTPIIPDGKSDDPD